MTRHVISTQRSEDASLCEQKAETTFADGPRPVFVDTDIGDDIDDALALALLLCSPEVKVVGISTVFGDTLLRARLASYILQVYGRSDIPVAAGQGQPFLWRHRPSGVCQASVLTDVPPCRLNSQSGPELLIRSARAYPGELTLLCLGPLTNLALALQKEPDLGRLLKRIFFMGGSSHLFWPDWNVRSDARAAQIVLDARLTVTMIGLNVTTGCRLRHEDAARIGRAKDARLRLLAQLIAAWREAQPRWHAKRPALHDPLVVAALCMPHFFHFAPLAVRVYTEGPLVGWTVPRRSARSNVCAALAADRPRARAWMLKRWLAVEGA